jgi:hypothetical protein
MSPGRRRAGAKRDSVSADSGAEVGVTMKALKIIAVVLGGLLLLTGIALLAGSAAVARRSARVR